MWTHLLIIIIATLLISAYYPLSQDLKQSYENFESLNIIPWNLVSTSVSQQVIDKLNHEWGDKNGVLYNSDFVSDIFDELYVLLSIENDLIGFVGIDREYIKPFISHLYVVEKWRNNGYGKKLLQISENYCRKRYHIVYLWCESEMISYYQDQGWRVHNGWLNGLIGKILMSKSF